MRRALLGMALATAFWTYKVNYITTVTGRAGVECEYQYMGRYFWEVFVGYHCPNSVEVE